MRNTPKIWKLLCVVICLLLSIPQHSRAKEHLRICVVDNSPPYVFFNHEQIRSGFNIDVLHALQLPYTLEYISTDGATAMAMVENDACNMLLTNTLITPQVQERFLLSNAHLQSDLHALVLKQSPLQNNAMLSSSIVGVRKGSSAEKYAFDALTKSTIIALKDHGELVTLLQEGKIEALIGHKIHLQALVNTHKELHILYPALQKQYFAFIFAKESTQLLEEVNVSLKQLEENNTLRALYAKWFTKQ